MKKNRPKSRSDVPWSKRQQIPDSQIVDVADQYEDACKLLFDHTHGVLWPTMNTAAVSIELYLKSLSAERIYTPDSMMPEASVITAYALFGGHPLKPLFEEAISDEVRTKLVEAYDANLRNDLKDSFPDILQKLDGMFAASRYPYEPNSKAKQCNLLKLLVKIAAFLREFVHALPPKEIIEWS